MEFNLNCPRPSLLAATISFNDDADPEMARCLYSVSVHSGLLGFDLGADEEDHTRKVVLSVSYLCHVTNWGEEGLFLPIRVGMEKGEVASHPVEIKQVVAGGEPQVFLGSSEEPEPILGFELGEADGEGSRKITLLYEVEEFQLTGTVLAGDEDEEQEESTELLPVSDRFIGTLKMDDRPNYKVAQAAQVDPNVLSRLINRIQEPRPNDTRVIAVGKILGLKPDECFGDVPYLVDGKPIELG